MRVDPTSLPNWFWEIRRYQQDIERDRLRRKEGRGAPTPPCHEKDSGTVPTNFAENFEK